MKYVIGAAVLVVSWVIGVLGISQIIGTLQNLKSRAPVASAFTLILWLVIMGAACFAVHRFIPDFRIVYYIGTGISLVQVLAAGRIQ